MRVFTKPKLVELWEAKGRGRSPARLPYRPPEVESWPPESWPVGWPPPWFNTDDLFMCAMWCEHHGKSLPDDFHRRVRLREYGHPRCFTVEAWRQRRGYRPGAVIGREIGKYLLNEARLPAEQRRKVSELGEKLRATAIQALRQSHRIPWSVRKAAIRAVQGPRAGGWWVRTACDELAARGGKHASAYLSEFATVWERLGGPDLACDWNKLVQPHFEQFCSRGRGRSGPGKRGRRPKVPLAVRAWFAAELMRQELKHGLRQRAERGFVRRITQGEREAAKIVFWLTDRDFAYRTDGTPPKGLYRDVLELLRKHPLRRG